MNSRLQVGNAILDEICFSNRNSYTETLNNLFIEVEEANSDTEKCEVIKQAIYTCNSKWKTDECNVEEIHTILLFFSKFSSKKVFKKTLQDISTKLQLTQFIIKRSTVDLSQQFAQKQLNLKHCINLVNFVCMMETLPTYDYDETIPLLFPIYYEVLKGYVYHLLKNNFQDLAGDICEDLSNLVNIILKQVASIFSRKSPYVDIVSKDYSAMLAVLLYEIIMSFNVDYEMKTKSAVIFIQCLNVMPEHYCECLLPSKYPFLEVLRSFYEHSHFTILNHRMEFHKNQESILFLYTAILSIVPQENLCNSSINGKKLICILYEGLLECAKNNTYIPHLVVEISRWLWLLSKYLKLVPVESAEDLFTNGLTYIMSHIDHFVDSVRNYVKLFFSELVSIAAKHNNAGYPIFIKILVDNIKSTNHFSIFRLLGYENMITHFGCSLFDQFFPDLPPILLKLISEPTICEQVTKTYLVILEMQYNKATSKDRWLDMWVVPVTIVLKNSTSTVGHLQKIMLKSFELHPSILHKIYSDNFTENPQECGVILKCLRHARTTGLTFSVENKDSSELSWRGLIAKQKLEKFMIHQENDIRISALAAIVEVQKSTETFLDWEFMYLLKYLHYNITSQIPNVRYQIQSLYKKALDRFNAGLKVIEKNITSVNSKKNVRESNKLILTFYEELHNSYKKFISSLTKQLVSYLSYDSNYPRRVITLNLLVNINSFMARDEWLNCWTSYDVKCCYNILFDGYESNKKLALILLENLPTQFIGFTSLEHTNNYLQHCLEIALDVKPSKTLSAPYLFQVCLFSPFFCEIDIKGAKNFSTGGPKDNVLSMLELITRGLLDLCSVQQSSSDSKVYHGLISSITHLLQIRDMSKSNESYSQLFEKLTKICLNMKEEILPVVCNSSPEGYLPEGDEIIPENVEATKAQMIVVNAWRSIKEMTYLLSEIIRQSVKLESTLEMLNENLMLEIGEFFLTVFMESKHRGVFEQAHVSFSNICSSFWSSKNPRLRILPQKWLEQTLELCLGNKLSDNLCPTRRSAGLPYLILSLLAASHTFSNPRISNVFTALFGISESSDSKFRDHQIHSLNIMRNLFRNNQLGEPTAPYIDRAAIIAIRNFSSDDWGVRNSATLLFSALMTRMFGVQRTSYFEDVCLKNKLAVRVFLMRFPNLFRFLAENIPVESQNTTSTTMHPMLLIVSRLYPSHFEDSNLQMEQLMVHIERCLSNQVYRSRDLAARASVPFIQKDNITKHLETILNNLCENSTNSNESHGRLLQVSYILRTRLTPDLPLCDYISKTIEILEYVCTKYDDMTVSLYFEILLTLLIRYNSYDNLEMLKKAVIVSSQQLHLNVCALMLILYILANKFEETDLTYYTISYYLMCQLRSRNSQIRRFWLNFLIYMHHTQKETPKHALFQLEERQIPSEIIMLVDTFEEEKIEKMLKDIHRALKDFLLKKIKYQKYESKEDTILLFLLINYYPCVMKALSQNRQETLDMFINLCSNDDEELISAAVSCISTFLQLSDNGELNYIGLLRILMESASPAAREYRRLAVCKFLIENYKLYGCPESALTGDALEEVLNIIMVLHEDDDLLVRKTMSKFTTIQDISTLLNKNKAIYGYGWPSIPEKGREDLLTLGSIIQPRDRSICFLFSWACRHFPDEDCETSEVFERGELNPYAENVSFASYCGTLLNQLLWDAIYQNDCKNGTVDKQALVVTQKLVQSLSKYNSPMVLKTTKQCIMAILNRLTLFLESFGSRDNILENAFSKYLEENVENYLRQQVNQGDLLNIRRILQQIYKPILRL